MEDEFIPLLISITYVVAINITIKDYITKFILILKLMHHVALVVSFVIYFA